MFNQKPIQMKKLFTFISVLGLSAAFAQTPLVNQSALITHPGMGAGGADVSATQTSTLMMTLYGSSQNYSVAGTYWIAEKIVVPASGWTLDSLITYGYQTGSTTVSTMTASRCYVSADSSNMPSFTPVLGSKTTNAMISTNFSNIYRAPGDLMTDLGNTQRPIMRIKSGLTGNLAAGTYWVCWSVSGTLASGPWNPPVTIKNVSVTGNAMQKSPTGWAAVVDGTNTQGMPFKLYGKITLAVKESDVTVNEISIHPSPMVSNASVNITLAENASITLGDLSFVMYDVTGKVVLNNTNINNSTFSIERGDLSAGTYLYKVINKNNGNSLKSGKLIIQ